MKNTPNLIIGLVAIPVLFYLLYKMDDKRSIVKISRIKSCKILDPKYNGKYKTKTGPFSNTCLLAKNFGEERIETEVCYGPDDTRRFFFCEELEPWTE